MLKRRHRTRTPILVSIAIAVCFCLWDALPKELRHHIEPVAHATSIYVVNSADDHDDGAYRFRCPECRRTVSRSASARIVGLLLSAGAPREVWQWPAELGERPDGPPLTHDDVTTTSTSTWTTVTLTQSRPDVVRWTHDHRDTTESPIRTSA